MRGIDRRNYGTLPSDAMPQTFLAHAYDLGDPWQSNQCVQWGCCLQSKYNGTACAKSGAGMEAKCAEACRAMTNTSYYM